MLRPIKKITGRMAVAINLLAGLAILGLSFDASALPLFARQTGQNCVACHAGGQFPELTPYGRMFKLTGYTIGDRVSVPLSVMAVAGYSKVSDTSKSDNPFGPQGDFLKNGTPVLASGSLFAGGKITDNIGAFIQWTYDNYAVAKPEGGFAGHSNMDNVDVRYADRFISPEKDLVFGVSLNNNPSVSDPWNTAAAWMQYVPAPSSSSSQFADANTPFPGFGSGGNVAGISAYMYWNKSVYAELGTYRTADGVFSPLSLGFDGAGTTALQGANNPYWRLALTHEWGPHNIMVGTSGMIAHVYDGPPDTPPVTSDPNSVSRIFNSGLDAQYQYILDPHTITAQVAYMRQKTDYSANKIVSNLGGAPYTAADGSALANPNNSDTTNVFRAKLSYVYQAKYGGSLAYFNLTGTTNTGNQTAGYNGVGPINLDANTSRVNANFTGDPATRGVTYEAFMMPVQYARVGVQYTAYSKFNGATDNYNGFGRNASDNNTLFLYVWGAY